LETIEKREKLLKHRKKMGDSARKKARENETQRYYKPREPEYYLTDEIPDSLRRAHQTTNPFETILDRFKKRSLIQARLPSEEERDVNAPVFKYTAIGSWFNGKTA